MTETNLEGHLKRDKFDLSRRMGKTTNCICETKGADQLCSNCTADQRLCFRYTEVPCLYFLNPKFPVSSHLLCLYSPVCVRPGWNPNGWFSHAQAHLLSLQILKPGGLESFQVVLKAQIVYKNALTCAVQQAHACQPAKEQEIIKR